MSFLQQWLKCMFFNKRKPILQLIKAEAVEPKDPAA
jgi:hypothetical protein